MLKGKTPVLPDTASRWSTRVLYADTDQMGVVNHAIYFRWFEAGRAQFMRLRGAEYSKIESQGLHLPVVETHVYYKSPAKYDDVVEVASWLSDMGRAQLRFDYIIWRGEQVLVKGYTHHAAVTAEGRPTRLPVFIKQRLLGPESLEK